METTNRGFGIIEFTDRYDVECSLQKSSLATEDAIWLGITEVNPVILASEIIEDGVGWAKFPIPDGVHINSRMHLNQQQVKDLLPHLIKFVETGELA